MSAGASPATGIGAGLRHLSVRLFASYVVVVAVGASTVYATVRILAPSMFDRQIGHMHGRGMPMGGGFGPAMHVAFAAALNGALLTALLASALVAGVVAAFVARRILRPLDDVRRATRRLADGHYDERVAPPRELELALLAADVNHLAASLADTEKRRVRLVSEIAHELRTPITTISGYVEGLLDGVFTPTEEVLVAVNEEVARLQRLAGDLSALSRADEGALELRLADADLGELAAAVAERLRPQFEEAGVTLSVVPGPQLPVRVDGQRVAQVVTNLVGNALTYTPAGGRVTLSSGRADGADGNPKRLVAWVAVSDTGAGLSAPDVERVFDRFYRVEGVRRPPGGSGIGLTIARGIALAHGGDVVVASPGPGRGATFTLCLPLARVAAERA